MTATPKPPKREAELPRYVAEPPQQAPELPQYVAEPPKHAPEIPQHVAEPPQQEAELPQYIAEPPQQEAELSQHVAEPPKQEAELPLHEAEPLRHDDKTRAVARLPGLDIEIERHRVENGERISIHLQATPSFDAFGRFIQEANPFAFWANSIQLAAQMWMPFFPWLNATRALLPPADEAPRKLPGA
ncbi:MAG TPA: hypothetical protein VH206_14905 [Xanthobacteraceae bacterium]|nr:hypothetical protein [Xanthobacteraceae bacterium]